MNSPIDNLLTRIDRLLLREIVEPDQTTFLQNIKSLLKTYRVEPEQFSDMLLSVYDIEKNLKKD
jgi:serine phosphatase RsbU (regulator of sigma subunit)